jgi:hypothetical protein
MTLEQATVKANEHMKAVNGNPRAYDVPEVMRGTRDMMIGKSFAVQGGTLKIEKIIGQNYLVSINAIEWDAMPVMYFCERVYPAIKAKEIV